MQDAGRGFGENSLGKCARSNVEGLCVGKAIKNYTRDNRNCAQLLRELPGPAYIKLRIERIFYEKLSPDARAVPLIFSCWNCKVSKKKKTRFFQEIYKFSECRKLFMKPTILFFCHLRGFIRDYSNI